MVRFDLPKLRIALLAALLDIVAALSKPALIRQIDRGRDSPLISWPSPRAAESEQRLGVGWSVLEQNEGLLHHLSKIHHRDIVRKIFNNRKVVGDEKCKSAPCPAACSSSNLCLDGNIQGGHGSSHTISFGSARARAMPDRFSGGAVQLMGIHG